MHFLNANILLYIKILIIYILEYYNEFKLFIKTNFYEIS